MTQNAINSTNPFVQLSNSSTSSSSTISSVIDYDDSIPQNTEGTEILTTSITPKSANSTLVIRFSLNCQKNTNGSIQFALFQDSNANALSAKAISLLNLGSCCCDLIHVMTSGTTSPTTFKIRIGVAANSVTINPTYSTASNAILLVQEYL